MAIERLRANEQSSRTVTFTLLDNASLPVLFADVATAQLTLFDMDTYVPGGSPVTGIINTRDAQNVLNTNDVTIAATSGLVTWSMQPEDNLIVTVRKQIERHRAEFRFVTTSGAELDYQFEVEVVNLRKAS